MTTKETILSEEELKKEETRLDELFDKKEKTEEEKKEFSELKKKKDERYQKKIDKEVSSRKALEYELEKERKEKEDLKKRIDEVEKSVKKAPLSKETIAIGEETFFTDEALRRKIESKEISEDEAYKHQQERIEASAADKAYKRIKKEQEFSEADKTREEDAEQVLKEHPEFAKNHPEHNPDDPFYRLVNEIYDEGYKANPKGLSLAIKRAKQILKKSDVNIEREDLGLEDSTPPQRKSREKEITLDEYEKESAIRMYCRGDVNNPKTGRPYTENEAIAKALQAKQSRGR